MPEGITKLWLFNFAYFSALALVTVNTSKTVLSTAIQYLVDPCGQVKKLLASLVTLKQVEVSFGILY
jgi:hypothetical protein